MYSIIYADPPWKYRDRATHGNRGACFKYPVLDFTSLSKLPVDKISAKNCFLFIWSTMPFLPKCLEIIKSWGFCYKTCAFVWVKKNKKSDSIFFGMGHWTRSNAELCLLATKGRPRRVNAGVHSIIISPRREHSRKPDVVRDRIVQMCGNIPRIELFAREKALGWDAVGNEIDGADVFEALNGLMIGQ